MTMVAKVIHSLERCTCNVPDACQDCPYDYKPAPDCWQSLERDALELLKEQEPRVLTLDEVLSQEWDYVYIETEHRPYSKEIEAYCGTHTIYCSTTVVHKRQTSGDSEYGKTWRCWTAKPTDEQRKAVKWDD